MALIAFSTTLSKQEENILNNGAWLGPYFTLDTENLFFVFQFETIWPMLTGWVAELVQ